MENRDSALKIFFWAFTAVALALVGWKFFSSQEQPMETKVLFVFLTFAVCALVYRLIRKRTQDERLERWSSEAIEWSDTGVSAVLLAFFIMAFVLQAFKIPSGSMQPTLQIGDHLFVNKFIYGTQVPFTLKRLWRLKPVQRMEVVVFLCPPNALSEDDRKNNVKKDFIKRAVGLPGDTVEIRDKILYINGEKIADPHAHRSHPMIYPKAALWTKPEEYQSSWERGEFVYLPPDAVRDNFGPVKVPGGHYFVLGDNRDGSFDSRYWGPLPDPYVKGRAWLVYWPFTRLKVIR